MTDTETYTGPDGEEYPVPRHDCDEGWLPDDPVTGLPKPCGTCKPHLRRHRRDLDAGMSGWTSRRVADGGDGG